MLNETEKPQPKQDLENTVKPPAPEIEKKAPNIKFIGKSGFAKDGETEALAEPPTSINNGMTVIDFPDAETQRAGFYHEQATDIVRLFPKLYKPIIEKGA